MARELDLLAHVCLPLLLAMIKGKFKIMPFSRRTHGRGALAVALVGALALALATTAIAAIASGGGAPVTTTATVAPDAAATNPGAPTVSAVPEVLSSKLSVLRQPRTAADEMLPAAAVDGFGNGANVDLSRLVGDAGGRPYYVVPAAAAACLVTSVGSGACSDAGTLTNGLVLTNVCGASPGHVAIVGLFVDGVDSIELDGGAAAPVALPVERNAVVAEIPVSADTAPPTQATWTGPDGRHSVQLPIPPDAATAKCGRPASS
jgi:hypothetical protein